MDAPVTDSLHPDLRMRAASKQRLGSFEAVVRQFEVAGFNVDRNNLAASTRHLRADFLFVEFAPAATNSSFG
jgi:hypothetical protein